MKNNLQIAKILQFDY